jgi:hypothetical protein
MSVGVGVRQPGEHDDRGQSLVEFALVFPLFMMLTLFIVEFAFVFSALLGVNYASRNAALIAAEAGNDPLADCVILQQVESSVGAPADSAKIQTVTIFRSDQSGGTRFETLTYTRGGAGTTCQKGTVTLTVPYSAPTGAYTYDQRCNILGGCVSLGRSQIDTIGVEVIYAHTWITPIRNFGISGDGANLTQSNAMRMEPIL